MKERDGLESAVQIVRDRQRATRERILADLRDLDELLARRRDGIREASERRDPPSEREQPWGD